MDLAYAIFLIGLGCAVGFVVGIVVMAAPHDDSEDQ